MAPDEFSYVLIQRSNKESLLLFISFIKFDFHNSYHLVFICNGYGESKMAFDTWSWLMSILLLLGYNSLTGFTCHKCCSQGLGKMVGIFAICFSCWVHCFIVNELLNVINVSCCCCCYKKPDSTFHEQLLLLLLLLLIYSLYIQYSVIDYCCLFFLLKNHIMDAIRQEYVLSILTQILTI